MSCRHKHVVLVGSNEAGLTSARCADCRAQLTRRFEGDGEYVYVAYRDEGGEVVQIRRRRSP